MKQEKLSHNNNFNLLRLLFAILVLVTHAYPLAGYPEGDYLYHISNGRFSFSYIGVRGFFTISGFLVYKSLIRSTNIYLYFKNRLSRILPGLIFVLICSVMIGAAITTNTIIEYLSSPDTWKFFATNLQLILRVTSVCLPGVFEQNPYGCTVNGSLWTISYEVLFYILLPIILIFYRNSKVTKILILILFLTLLTIRGTVFESLKTFQYMVPYTNFDLTNLIELGLYFIAGMLIYEFENLIDQFKKLIILSAASLFCLIFFLEELTLIIYIALPLLVVLLGKTNSGKLTTYCSKFDFSYGIYLWGFPVQQLFVSELKLNHLELMAISIPVCTLLGAVSWFFVEKRFLNRVL